jgi:DNA-binding transcriptional MocR family regulator
MTQMEEINATVYIQFLAGPMSNEMSRWAVAMRDGGKPAYMAIADLIRDEIQSGILSANQRLPTLRKLAKALKLNFTTVARGYAEAQRRGLIDTRAGSGTFVREFIKSGPVRRSAPSNLVDMTMNMPPEPRDRALLQRMRDGIAALADEIDPYAVLRYQEFGGAYEDREAGVRWMSRHQPGLTSARVLVCPGIQSALWALCAVLAPRVGDAIACEAITYPGLKGIAAQLGIRLVGLPWDDRGIDPEAFGALCARDLPKALYLNPTLNNPTTAVMSQERREAVVDIARRYSVPIIEDDPYGGLPVARPAALAALAPELVFFVTGFAKCLGAGLRIAYVATPNARYTVRVAATLRTTTVMAAPLMVRLATRWINDGTVNATTLAIREESRFRQQMAREVLRRAHYTTKPEAFHLWLSVPDPWSRSEFSTHLRAHGVPVVASDSFTVAGVAPEAVRVCLGGPADRDECRHSLGIIEDAVEQLPAVALRGM